MKKLSFYSAIMMSVFAVASCQDQHKAKNYNDKTLADGEAINFIKKGIEGGLTEIKASGIAKTQSSNPRVVNFASMMIAEHSQVNTELKQIEVDKMIDDRDSISIEHQTMISDIAAKTGATFDKAYMQMMVSDHEKAIELFKTVSNNTSATMQKVAEKTLPILQMHLDSAKAINSSLK